MLYKTDKIKVIMFEYVSNYDIIYNIKEDIRGTFMKLPKVGLRILKTIIAVFLSVSLYIILLLINKSLGLDVTDSNAPTSFYTPFFAAIAAAFALHRDKSTSLKHARIRSYGSIVGGYYGMLVILLNDYLFSNLMDNHFIIYELITFFIVSFAIIPIILFSVKVKQPDCIFITLLTYFSVTISSRNGGQAVIPFATNRVISTLVGIGISLFINMLTFHHHKNKDYLFVSSLENTLLTPNTTSLSPYMIYKLNNLFFKKMPLCFVTTKTVSSLSYVFDEVEINFPLVVMNGAAIYNFTDKTHLDIFYVKPEVKEYMNILEKEEDINIFSYAIDENYLNCYYQKKLSNAEKLFIDIRKSNNSDNFVRGIMPNDLNPSLYMILDKKEKIEKIKNKLITSNFSEKIDVITFPYKEYNDDYYFLKLNSREAKKENLVNKIMIENNYEKLIVCGSVDTDIALIESADFSICLNSAPEIIRNKVDIVLDEDPSSIFKVFEKIYHTKNFEKTKKRIKKQFLKKYERRKK